MNRGPRNATAPARASGKCIVRPRLTYESRACFLRHTARGSLRSLLHFVPPMQTHVRLMLRRWGENLCGVDRQPVSLIDDSKLVYSPHTCMHRERQVRTSAPRRTDCRGECRGAFLLFVADGPSVYKQHYFDDHAFPSNMRAIWEKRFGFVRARTGAPVVIGEMGGFYTGKDRIWQDWAIEYLAREHVGMFYFALQPGSEDTGGLLKADYTAEETAKVELLSKMPSTDVSTAQRAGRTSSALLSPRSAAGPTLPQLPPPLLPRLSSPPPSKPQLQPSPLPTVSPPPPLPPPPPSPSPPTLPPPLYPPHPSMPWPPIAYVITPPPPPPPPPPQASLTGLPSEMAPSRTSSSAVGDVSGAFAALPHEAAFLVAQLVGTDEAGLKRLAILIAALVLGCCVCLIFFCCCCWYGCGGGSKSARGGGAAPGGSPVQRRARHGRCQRVPTSDEVGGESWGGDGRWPNDDADDDEGQDDPPEHTARPRKARTMRI